eukprot:15045182-Alexandrium_andersonii.AAC.1
MGECGPQSARPLLASLRCKVPNVNPRSAQGPSVPQSAPIGNPPCRSCKTASSGRSLNCTDPRTVSNVAPRAPTRYIPYQRSSRFRIDQRT